VDQVIHLRTVHLGPDNLLVAAEISVSTEVDAEDIAATINAAEAQIRDALPIARIIYVEPDIYRVDATKTGARLSHGAESDHRRDGP